MIARRIAPPEWMTDPGIRAITAHRVKCLRWRDGAYEDLYTCAVCEAMHWVDGVEEAD